MDIKYFIKLIYINIRKYFPVSSFGCIWLPLINDEIFEKMIKNEPYECHEINFLHTYLKKGDVFLDIGANFGLYSIIAAKIVEPSGKVFSIEPEPRNVKRLRRNAQINRVPINIFPVALGQTIGYTDFFSCSQGAYSGIKICDTPGIIKKIVVSLNTLDNLSETSQWPTVDLVKMDVEGAEIFVLQGGNRFFSREKRPIVLIEFSDQRTHPYGYDAKEIFNWLSEKGYTWYRFCEDGLLEEQSNNETYVYDNLIGCPHERKSLIQKIIRD